VIQEYSVIYITYKIYSFFLFFLSPFFNPVSIFWSQGGSADKKFGKH